MARCAYRFVTRPFDAVPVGYTYVLVRHWLRGICAMCWTFHEGPDHAFRGRFEVWGRHTIDDMAAEAGLAGLDVETTVLVPVPRFEYVFPQVGAVLNGPWFDELFRMNAAQRHSGIGGCGSLFGGALTNVGGREWE